MEESKKVLIKRRLEKAYEDLETARELFISKRYRALSNRAYYAVFATTNAILLTKMIERIKHSGVESAFNQFFVKTGIFEKLKIKENELKKYIKKQNENE